MIGAALAAMLALPPTSNAGGFFVVTPSPGKQITVDQPNVILTMNQGEVPVATIQTPYSFSMADLLQVTGDPKFNPADVTFQISSKGMGFPSGLVLDEHGLMSGKATTKTTASGARFEVEASYKDKSAKQLYTIIVNGRPLQAVAVAKASGHACAITPEGGVVCWGANSYGQLGDGTVTYRAGPVAVLGLESGVTDISAGGSTTCAIQSGALKCWGHNSAGQLGDNTTNPSNVPRTVSDMYSGVTKVSVGSTSAVCAVKDGGAYCWGYNGQGQLGDGSTTSRAVPTPVVGLATGVTDISTRASHSCAVQATTAKCWGMNYAGQVGDGSTTTRLTPVLVDIQGQMLRSISVGNDHTCAITYQGVPPRDTRRIRCWGANSTGQLGDGTTVGKVTPVELLGTGATSISAGWGFTCAGSSTGALCWGSNGSGQLGTGGNEGHTTPTPVVGLGATSQVVTSDESSCAVAASIAKCWGSNFGGSLGDGTAVNRPIPVSVEVQ